MRTVPMPASPILLIESAGTLRRGLRRFLVDCGDYEVFGVEDCAEALAQLGNGLEPRVIVLNLRVPGAAEFRCQLGGGQRRDIPVITYSTTSAAQVAPAPPARLQLPAHAGVLLELLTEHYRSPRSQCTARRRC